MNQLLAERSGMYNQVEEVSQLFFRAGGLK